MKKNIGRTAAVVAVLCATILLAGCAGFSHQISEMHGSIIGNSYTIDTFDNFGTLVLKTHGDRIDVSPVIVREYTYIDDTWGYTNTMSSAINITIDGEQIVSCGDTCIFYDDRLVPDYNFSVNSINSSAGLLEFTSVSGLINQVKNYIGKQTVVVIKSQTGYPIYVFSGNSVYWEVPENLPKFTKLSIDGKPLYIHRANYQIIDRDLIK